MRRIKRAIWEQYPTNVLLEIREGLQWIEVAITATPMPPDKRDQSAVVGFYEDAYKTRLAIDVVLADRGEHPNPGMNERIKDV